MTSCAACPIRDPGSFVRSSRVRLRRRRAAIPARGWPLFSFCLVFVGRSHSARTHVAPSRPSLWRRASRRRSLRRRDLVRPILIAWKIRRLRVGSPSFDALNGRKTNRFGPSWGAETGILRWSRCRPGRTLCYVNLAAGYLSGGIPCRTSFSLASTALPISARS